ncbi:hypothetical protein FBU30_006198 [Linnemannia zychae]|nr:hypothetical protein FBU30_006198 [Linnemannia zychae]
MPVSVNDPFLLASFSSTTHHQQQQQAVSCSPEERDSRTVDSNNDEDSSLLVAAVQGEGVQLFNTADQKCILSYSTPPGYSFAGAAQTVLKSTLRHTYAVVAKGTDITAKDESKTVWMWKEESSIPSSVAATADSDMAVDIVQPSSAKKTVHKFDHKIFQLFASTLLPNHIILVNADATISLATGDLKRAITTKELLETPTTPTTTKTGKKDKKEATSAQIKTGITVWATSFNTTGSWISSNALARQTLVILTVVETSDNKLTITLSYVDEDNRGFSTFGAVDLDAAAGASGFAFDVKTGQFSFLTTDGHLKVYSFEVSMGDHVLTARETLTLPLPGYAASSVPAPVVKVGKKGSKVAVTMDTKTHRVDSVALGDNYLAIAGIHQINGKAELTMTIWDIQYGTLQAKHIVPGNFTTQNTTCQLALLPESTLVLTISTLINSTIKSDVYLCPFYAEPMSLLGAMGKMKDTAPFLGKQGSILTQDAYTSTTTTLLTPSDLASLLKGKDLLNAGADLDIQLDTTQSAEKEALKLLASESSTSTVQEFESVFFKYIEKQTADAISERLARHNVDVEKDTTANNDKAIVSQDMEVDAEPVAAATSEAQLSKKKKKKAAKAAKAAAKEVHEEKKTSKDIDAEGSSSESSSDEDDEEAIVLSSDEEGHEEVEAEEEDEYVVAEHEERSHQEANAKAIESWRKLESAAMKQKDSNRVSRFERKPAPLPELSHHFLTTIIGRCFTHLSNGQPDMSFWPTKVVEYLIKNQLVGNSNPGAGEGGIALGLMEREQWSLLELALGKLYDIPEMDVVVMLKQVIGLNKQIIPSETTKKSSVPDVTSFLKTVLVTPRNDIFMQQAIKRLSVEDLAIILEIMKDWFLTWEMRGGLGHQNQYPNKRQLPDGLPGFGLLVDFMAIILDVHFPSLILSPHLHPVLKTIQDAINREAEGSNMAEQNLRGVLGLYDRSHQANIQRKENTIVNKETARFGVTQKRRRRKLVPAGGLKDYAVEIIHL